MTVLAHTVENANHRHTISIGNLFGLCEKVRVSSILYVWIPLNSLCPYSIGWLSSTLCTGYEADIMRVSLLICEWGTSKARNVEKGTSLQSRVSRTLLFCLEFMTVCDVWVSLIISCFHSPWGFPCRCLSLVFILSFFFLSLFISVLCLDLPDTCSRLSANLLPTCLFPATRVLFPATICPHACLYVSIRHNGQLVSGLA